jgi:hypothetical protein
MPVIPGYKFRHCEVCKKETSQKATEKGWYCNKHKGLANSPKK